MTNYFVPNMAASSVLQLNWVQRIRGALCLCGNLHYRSSGGWSEAASKNPPTGLVCIQ